MTTPNNTVAGLAEKWRKEADDAEESAIEANSIGLNDAARACGKWAKLSREHADELEAALASPAPSAGVVEAFDAAVAAELPRVSHVQYDSHEICKHFAGEVRKRLPQHPAAPSVGGSVALHESGQMADFLNDVSASTDLTLGAARIALSEAAIRFREIAIAPETGSWIAAGDVNRLTREIDVALNGEEGAAMRPMLCDIAGQVCEEARKLGRPLLAAAPSAPPSVAGDAGELLEVVDLSDRAEELAERLVASGPKAAHVSASETHELSEWVLAAAPLIRRLATAEQPGSAVQGESWKCEVFDLMRANAQELGFVGIADALDHIASTRTTPPPAPAAEQGDTWHGFRFVRDDSIPVGEASIRQGAREVGRIVGIQSEARGVEGMGEWTEDKLRVMAKERGWHVRESASVPTEDGYRHPFEVCIPSRDLLRMLAATPSGVRVDDAMVERAVEEIRKAKHTCFDRWTDHQAMRAALTAALAGKDGAK